MTDEEAIEELKMDVALYDNDIVRMKEFKDTPDAILIHALEMGINALEKQIPKHIVKKRKEDTHSGKCAVCGVSIHALEPKDVLYCWHCGQAIDWSVMMGNEN